MDETHVRFDNDSYPNLKMRAARIAKDMGWYLNQLILAALANTVRLNEEEITRRKP